jgi:predicted tellurium resistance membrane protein TerC
MPLRAILFISISILAVLTLAADEAPPEVIADTVDGRTVTGRLLTTLVRLENEYGAQEIDSRHIRRITFRPPDAEKGQDIIELSDKSHVRGRIVTDVFQIDTGSGIERLSRTALRELKAVAQKSPGLIALLIGLVTLAAMEIVLGIDNIIFLAIVASKLPEAQQPRARRIGLLAALGTRILLLFSLSFLLGLTKPVFTIPELPYFHDVEAREVSMRDLILLAGGLFLLYKSVREMHEKLESAREGTQEGTLPAAPTGPVRAGAKAPSFGSVLLQIAVLDIVFSLDSVITAIGMVDVVWVMIAAMVIAMIVMMVLAGSISNFVSRHPTIKVLALAFLILIGVLLVAESLGQHIDKGYIYFAMAFAVGIEMINLRLRKKPVPAGKVTV